MGDIIENLDFNLNLNTVTDNGETCTLLTINTKQLSPDVKMEIINAFLKNGCNIHQLKQLMDNGNAANINGMDVKHTYH